MDAIGVGRSEDLSGEVEAVVVVVGGREREIGRGHFALPNRKPSVMRSVSVWY
jgi:hypothetical protein